LVRAELDRLGISYRQEEKVGRWSVDFLLDRQVVLEADGGYWHASERIRARDARRDSALARLGYTTIRLSEADLRVDPEIVQRTLRRCGLIPRGISLAGQTFFAWSESNAS
jgi:very-short-patch-repair endonuclease